MPALEDSHNRLVALEKQLARDTLIRDLLTWSLQYSAQGSIPFEDLRVQLMKEHHAPPA